MPLPPILKDKLLLPVIGAPMFIVSQPALVKAQCLAGIIGSFPALNARPSSLLDEWLLDLNESLDSARRTHPGRRIAPYAVNQIIHQSNDRLDHDLDLCVKHRVPLVITSLRAPDEVVNAIHSYGGLVFHDVTNLRHAHRAAEAGVDGLILVASGAGGHAGRLSPFALLAEVRRFWSGTVALAGAITGGNQVLAAQAMGADLAYMGTRFIATKEANAIEAYKQAILDSRAEDVVYTPFFTGVPGNYLRSSIVAQGLDPDDLPHRDKSSMDFGSGRAKAWRDIWGAGQGVGSIDAIRSVAEVVETLNSEYLAARTALCG